MPFVYFIQAGADGPIKIGVADDPEKRLNELQIGNHAELFLRARRPGGLELERELHARFWNTRVRGEWFADTPGLDDAITEALHFETLEAIHGALCPVCEMRPIIPPRLKFCSSPCASAHARRRSRDWKRTPR